MDNGKSSLFSLISLIHHFKCSDSFSVNNGHLQVLTSEIPGELPMFHPAPRICHGSVVILGIPWIQGLVILEANEGLLCHAKFQLLQGGFGQKPGARAPLGPWGPLGALAQGSELMVTIIYIQKKCIEMSIF